MGADATRISSCRSSCTSYGQASSQVAKRRADAAQADHERFAHNLQRGPLNRIDMSTGAIYVGLSIRRGRAGRPSALLDAEHFSASSPQGTVHEELFVKNVTHVHIWRRGRVAFRSWLSSNAIRTIRALQLGACVSSPISSCQARDRGNHLRPSHARVCGSPRSRQGLSRGLSARSNRLRGSRP